MPRRLRIHVPGGFYHATLRGNHQQAIFRTPSDRALLNAIVARSLKTHLARVHAYCWMTNHLHFFIQVGDAPLGMVMRDIASNYARAYQAKLETTGHLFERRYHAKVVDIDAYLFAVLRYVHLNPVTDGLVRCANDYPWSSHRAYAGIDAPLAWLETDFVLAVFAPERRAAQLAYRRFIGQAVPGAEDPMAGAGNGEVLGDDEFTTRVLNKPSRPRAAGRPLEQLIEEGCAKFGVSKAQLTSASRDLAIIQARAWISRRALDQGTATLSEIARILGRDRATLRYAMQRHAGTPESPK